MAISCNYEIPGGINLNLIYTDFEYCTKSATETITDAYVKIININGDKNSCKVKLGIFKSKNKNLICTEEYEFAPDVSDTALNFIKQGYEYIKTLDKYKNALDLLDEGQAV